MAVLQARLEASLAQLEKLRAEVETLRARLRQNPRNSSKPPSAGGLGSRRQSRCGRSQGAGRPKGQPGATLELTDDLDEVVTHEPGRCTGCGAGMSSAPVSRVQRRQVTDLPEGIRARVTEHRIISRRCWCGTVTAGTAPPAVIAPVQYGPRVTAVCAHLWHGQFLSRDRTCQAARELFGVPVSPGAVTGMVRRVAATLGAPLEAVIDAAPPGQWCWAAQAADAQRTMKRLADASLVIDGTLDHLDQAKLAAARHEYHSALLIGQRQTAARAGPLMRKHHALARRLLQRPDDYLRYTTDPQVPFDNNAAEREIRMGKLRIKVSGSMRSMAGAEAFCAIRSYLSTAAKYGIGMLDALTRAASRTPWTPETA